MTDLQLEISEWVNEWRVWVKSISNEAVREWVSWSEERENWRLCEGQVSQILPWTTTCGNGIYIERMNKLTQHFAEISIMKIWIFVGQSFPFRFGPNHERVHRTTDPLFCADRWLMAHCCVLLLWLHEHEEPIRRIDSFREVHFAGGSGNTTDSRWQVTWWSSTIQQDERRFKSCEKNQKREEESSSAPFLSRPMNEDRSLLN